MTLKKRYSRSIKSNLSFYVSTTILTVMTLILVFIMYMGGKAIWEFGDTFFVSQNLEDAEFETYQPISAEAENELEEEFGVTLEAQYYNNIETDGITARVFKKTKEINLYSITVGEDNIANDEVILSEGYAVFNEIAIGDTIQIGEKEYRVTGFFQRPDYLYMLQNEGDAYKNVTTFFLAYVTDEEFAEIGSENCLYLVRYGEGDSSAFRKAVNERYYMSSYLAAQENMRIDMVKMQAELMVYMAYGLLVVMPLIVVVLVSIVINRKVKAEQKLIGTLTALGYKKPKLMLHYAGFAMIPGLLGGTLGVGLILMFAQSFGELCLMDYEPMRIECHMNPGMALVSILVPTLMYVLAAMHSVNKLLKEDTVLLLNGNADQGEKSYRNLLRKKKISFRIKYALRSLIGNQGRSFVVLLGIFLGSFIALLGFGLMDTMEYTQKNMVDEMGSYEYQYVLKERIEGSEYGGEPLILFVMEDTYGEQFQIIGTQDSNPYLDLKDVNGASAHLKDGYYITSVMAKLRNLESGDKMTICNPLTLEETEITVSGIIDNDMQNAVFTDKARVAKLLGIDESISNVIMSDVPLEIPEKKLMQTIKKSDAKEQFQNMTNQMNTMIYFIIGMGAVICVASIYVAVNMLVAENRANISMLKVLGYDNKNINQIVLRINHILVPIGFLLGIPAVFALSNWFMMFLAGFIGMLPKTYIASESLFYTAILIGISYFGSLFLLRRKVSKVDMVESLKGNRE